MRRSILVLLLLVLALGVAPSASAGLITLSPAQLAGFVYNPAGSSGPVPVAAGFTGAPGNYGAVWFAPAAGAVSVDFQLAGVSFGVAGDTFQFVITNENENIWDFSVSINGGAVSGPVSLTPVILGGSGWLVEFAGIMGPITQVDIFLTQIIPVIGPDERPDRIAEFQVSAVPEPGTLILLGTGLLGAARASRRRRLSR